MSVLVTDPEWAAKIIADREDRGIDKYDEVWDGVYLLSSFKTLHRIRVLAPTHDNVHRLLVMEFCTAFQATARGEVYPGVAISDREAGWEENYRIPDVAFVLAADQVKDCGTHLRGGAALVVEIQCPGFDPRKKNSFYAEVGTREVLIVDRDPWRLELYHLRDGVLELAGKSDLADPVLLTSHVMPLTFQLRQGPSRPIIHMVHTGTGQAWTA